MSKIIMYTAQSSVVLAEKKETIELKTCNLELSLESDKELLSQSPVAYLYEDPSYNVQIKIKDLDISRSFIDFRNVAEKVINSFRNWCVDIKGIKFTKPFFEKAYVDNKSVDWEGKGISGSATMTLYKDIQRNSMSVDEMNSIFVEIDEKRGILPYTAGKEHTLNKRRQIVMSRNEIGNYVSLYSFLMEVIHAKNQYDVDVFIRKSGLYDAKNDRKSTKIGKKNKETIYTWLRNQIAHLKPKGTDYEKVNEEINEWYWGLYELTFFAVSK